MSALKARFLSAATAAGYTPAAAVGEFPSNMDPPPTAEEVLLLLLSALPLSTSRTVASDRTVQRKAQWESVWEAWNTRANRYYTV